MASKKLSAPVNSGLMELSKEEKEALLEKKLEGIRRKNAALQKRHQEIEADRKAAEQSGMAVNPKIQTSTAPLSPKKDMKGVGEDGRTEDRRSAWAAGRGKRLKSNQDKQQPNKDESREVKPPGDGTGRLRIRNSNPLARDVGPLEDAPEQTEEGRPPSGPRRGVRRPARGGRPPLASQNSNSPPPDPGFSFLSDRGRQGPLPRERPRRGEALRHPRNFGGSDFGDVRNRMKAVKERHQGRRSGAPPTPDLELTLTGKERREYLQWKEERAQIDQARINRQKAASGTWKREWDADKNENFEPPQVCPPSPKHLTPHRRPGRIGSGRFQHAQLAAAERAVVSLPGALRQGGRGTGRGRGYRDKSSSPAPGRRLRLRKISTSSDDRSVDAHHNSLVIKIDNEFAKAAETKMDKRVQFRTANGNRGRGDAAQGRGRRGEQPTNRGGGRRAGIGSGRLRPGSSWQPQDQEEYWEDEGAIMPPVADTQPPPPPVYKPKTKPVARETVTTKQHKDPAAAVITTNGSSEVKPKEDEANVPKTEAKANMGDSQEMINVNEEDLDDDDDDQWLDIDDPHDFYDMQHGNLGEFSDEEDVHNSSAESLERFIQEHTLRIDESTGLAAQTPPESQNSQTSQNSQDSQTVKAVDHSFNDSKESGSDRASSSKNSNLSDSEYEAAPSPSDNVQSAESKEDDETKVDSSDEAKESAVTEHCESAITSEQVSESNSDTKSSPATENSVQPETEPVSAPSEPSIGAEEPKADVDESAPRSEENESAAASKSDAVEASNENKEDATADAVETSNENKENDNADAVETSNDSKESDNAHVVETSNDNKESDSGDAVDNSNENEKNGNADAQAEDESNQQNEVDESKSEAKESAAQDLDSSCGSRSEEEKFEDAREGAASSASSEATQSGTPEHKPNDASKEEEKSS